MDISPEREEIAIDTANDPVFTAEQIGWRFAIGTVIIVCAYLAWPLIPVVMMTGLCGEEQMRLAAARGANSYTLKPANAEQFLRTVLASTNYWLTIHQYPERHLPPEECRK